MTSIDKKFSIEFIASQDEKEVIQLVEDYFFKDEPITKSLGKFDYTGLKKWVSYIMQEKISFKAVDPANGKIIGVLLNIKLSPTDGPGPQVEDVSVPETRTILKLFEYLKTNFDLFKRYSDCSTAFEAHMLAVNTTYRGWGIGKALLVHTLDFAKEQGYPICVCVCTSKYSGQLCEALGFDGSYRLAYSDYFVDGKNPITPEAPHTEVVSYVKRL